jgi:hypothetical protein
MAKTEVAEVKKSEMTGFDYGESAHDGFGDVTINDLSIPFLNVLQSLSPEVEEQTIPGAAAGMILNSVTKEIMPLPIIFQPFYREEIWVNWRPRTAGGGVISRHEPSDPLIQAAIAKNGGSRIPPRGDDKKIIPFKGPDGGELIETYYIYGLILDETGENVEGYGVLAFSSTKIKPQKDWMSAMYTVKGRPPLYAHRAKISTVREKRESGASYNFSIAPFAPTWKDSLINPATEAGIALITQAKSMRDMVINGLARADQSGMGSTHDEETNSNSGGSASGGKGKTRGGASGDDEIPF